MTKEQIREKAFEFVSERASGTVKEMDYYANILTEFATEVTKELEKENAELKSLKDVADLIRLNNSHIVAMAQLNNNNVALRKENAELKSDNDARKFAMAMSEKVEKQLREENAGLKTDYEVLSCSVGEFGELQNKLEEEQRKNNGLSDNLTKAKELLRKLVLEVKGYEEINGYDTCEPVQEAEQFLNSEVEK